MFKYSKDDIKETNTTLYYVYTEGNDVQDLTERYLEVTINLEIRGNSKMIKFPLSTFHLMEDQKSRSNEEQVDLVIYSLSNKFMTNWLSITTLLKKSMVLQAMLRRSLFL